MKKLAEIFNLYLLVFSNSLCSECMCSLEDLIKRSIVKEIEIVPMYKRQLSHGIDYDASETIGHPQGRDEMENTTEDDYITTPISNEPTTGSVCTCNKGKGVENKAAAKSKTVMPKMKLLPRVIIREDAADFSDKIRKRTKENPKHHRNRPASPPAPTPTPTPAKVLNETHFEMNESEFQANVEMRDFCPYYKEVPKLDVDKMADVWQLSYYKSEQKLQCFKIFLKKTTAQSRKHFDKNYSSFNGTINWKECLLELTSSGKTKEDRKHFLQVSKYGKNILENIVLAEHSNKNNKIITLQEQAPDQWLVTKNLLLMRDCDNGDVVIFTRVPIAMKERDMEEAMAMFGENGSNGTEPCVRRYEKEEPFVNEKYDILS